MLLENKTAVIYGAGGAIGGAVARSFAREGARLFLTGRNVAKADAVAKEIAAAGGVAKAAQVDALDEKAVEEHLNTVVERAGGVDISFNAIGLGRRPTAYPWRSWPPTPSPAPSPSTPAPTSSPRPPPPGT